MKINFHTHTRWSDGYLTTEALIMRAKEEGLGYLAITDHDRTMAWSSRNVAEVSGYVGGLERLHSEEGKLNLLKSGDLRIPHGVELTTNDNSIVVHILGLYIDPPDKEFQIYLQFLEDQRWTRAAEIAKNLKIDMESVQKLVGYGLPSRLHFGYLLYLQMKDEDPDIGCARDAMDKYLGPHTEAYVSFQDPVVYTPQTAIEKIIERGGIPFWCHYERTKDKLPLDPTFQRYQEYAQGRQFGMEVTDETFAELADMMKRFPLVSVGNDYHGHPYERKGSKTIGIEVPDEVIQLMEEAHEKTFEKDYRAITR